LLYLGRLKPYKNINIAIEAFSEISQKQPEATLTIAGFGEIINDLRYQVKKLKLSDKIKILGKVSEEEKLKLLTESWVAIQPSSFEGWGLTVLEANVCRTPVIASNVPGLRDSVKDGFSGILVPVRDAKTLGNAMMKVTEDAQFRQELSENAYKWAEQFNWEFTTSKFMSVVEKEIAKRKILRVKPQVAQSVSE